MSKERGNDNEKDALFVPDIVEQRIQQVDIENAAVGVYNEL